MVELMDAGERKEEPSVPPDYVSLAQLQERWLQRQEEKKLMEKKEEERKLKEKQEEEEERERDARAQKGKNQNLRGMMNDGRAKIEGEFARERGSIEDKGKGKVMAIDGPENRENYERKAVTRGRRRMGFQRAPAVEEKVEVGVAGDMAKTGVLREEGGGGGGVVEVCSVCVVEALPINGVGKEIGVVKRTNLRGELRGNGRNELDESEMALGFEKKVEGERNHDENRRGRGRRRRIWRERDGGNKRSLNLLEELRPVVSENKGEDEVSGVCHEVSSLSIGDRKGIKTSKSSNKAGEDRVEEECSTGVEIEEKADHETIAGEGARIGGNKGTLKGYQRKVNRRRGFGQERRYTRLEISAKVDNVEEEGSNGNKVALEVEKKVDPEVLAGESATLGEKKGVVKGYRKNKNRRRDFGQERRNARLEISAQVDIIQEEGSNDSKVALEIEKPVDPEVLAGETATLGENKRVVKGFRRNEDRRRGFGEERRYTRSGMSPKVDSVEEEVSNGNKVTLEIEKEVEPEVFVEESATLGEKKGVVKGYQRNENPRRDFGQERRHSRLGNMGIVDGYPRNGYWRKGSGQERRHTRRPEMNSGESCMVWVKKEEKFGA